MKKGTVSQLALFSTIICLMIAILAIGCTEPVQTKPTATAPAKPTGPKLGGIFKVGAYTEGTSLGYPPTMVPGANRMQAAPAIEPLFRYDPTGNLVPWLATGYKENVADKSVTITLKKGIKFHDGTDLNADAAKWCLETYAAAKMAGTERFKTVDVIDDYTFRINLSEWDNTVITTLPFTGMMISPTAFKKNGQDWAVINPIGTGPFQFVSFARDTKTVYKKFDGYWQKGKPYVDGVEWVPILNLVTRGLSFRGGEIDAALWLDTKDKDALEKEGYKITQEKISTCMGMVGDSINPSSPWANVKVRQAAQYAIDNQAIVTGILKGQGEAPNQIIFKGNWAYNPDIVGYPYNPTKAKQLLAEAGYPNGFKTNIYNLQDLNFDPIYGATQNYLKAVGIDATLNPILAAKWMELAVRGGKWDGLMHIGAVQNLDVAGVFTGRFFGGNYYSQMLIPDDYRDAVKNAVTAPDFVTKQKYTREASKLMIDKYCLINPLDFAFNIYANGKAVRNSGLGETVTWWTPEEVWLDK
jgi:peptide/nickel transport system substrate-binding protein